jgi:hypothetical protein
MIHPAKEEFQIPARLQAMSKEAMLKVLKTKYEFELPVSKGKEMYASKENVAFFLARFMGLTSKKHETDEEVDARLAERFDAMETMVDLAISGEIRSLVIVGAAGLGKSYTVETKLHAKDPTEKRHKIVRGYSTSTALIKLLWDHRHEGMILVLDDCDAVRNDEKGLNLLKVATDTSKVRRISYQSEGARMISDRDNSIIPPTFEFNGTLMFITNSDLEAEAESSGPLSEHMAALLNRAHYINLTLRSRRDYLVRIRQVVYGQGMLNDMPERDRKDVMVYVEKHHNALRDLSLRTVLKVANWKRLKPEKWEAMCKVDLFPNNV